MTPVRGRIYWADVGYGEKPFLCVSNNGRNHQLQSMLAVRITTSVKPELASIVPLGSADPLVGSILCDNLVELWRDEVLREGGSLSMGTMMRVGTGLKAALALL